MGSRAASAETVGRRARRRAVEESTRLRPNGWSSLEVEMVDVSEHGFRARCEARVSPGSGVTLDIPGIGPVQAQVEWQRGGELGARFPMPIDLAHCAWVLPDGADGLAHLLVHRARAKTGGRVDAEAQIRQQILASLPMRRITSA
jgi:hypothetical protein